MKLLIVGVNQLGHVGNYFVSAGNSLNLDFTIIDSSAADAHSRIGRSFSWHFRGKRPGRLAQFATQVIEECQKIRPELIVTTGRAPFGRTHVETLKNMGATVVNYSTDDPWNPRMRAPWFLEAIPSYNAIFTTRRANMDEFRRCGVQTVRFLPFGYDPIVHRPWTGHENASPPSDVLFVGGCDADRMPLIEAVIDAGFSAALFGGYWDRHRKTRPFSRGIADQDTIRAASAAAKICLCLVRRANRDGSVMRSFEAAAIGGCILAEDTDDHKELFGSAARFFRSPAELVAQVRDLVADSEARFHLAAQLRQLISAGGHTYADRLLAMLRLCGHDNQFNMLQ